MIKGIVNNIPKDIKRVVMPVGGVDKGWEVRDQLGNLLWGAEHTLAGIDSINFKGYGTSLTAWSIYGNMVQDGTPTPSAPIMPDFCGKLVGTDWKIPISCADQTVPVYLGQTQTVRRIKKLVLTGDETGWTFWNSLCLFQLSEADMSVDFRGLGEGAICDCLPVVSYKERGVNTFWWSTGSIGQFVINVNSYNLTQLKAYLADNPITVWYVLTEPQTAIVNEPLAKIGDYADELHSADAEITISTTRGQNVLTVGTDLQPSSVTISGHIK